MQFINLNHQFNFYVFFMTRIKKTDKFEMKIQRVDLIFFFKSRKRNGEGVLYL